MERIRSQMVALRDGRLETAADDTELGVGLRVVHDGSMGFAATVAVEPEAAAALADQAVDAARTTALAGGRRVELADEPGHGHVDLGGPPPHRPGDRSPGRQGGAAWRSGADGCSTPPGSTTSPPTSWP